MKQRTRNRLSLYEEAKAGLSSLVRQTAAVFLGFVLMLLATGGSPSTLVITLSVCLGIVFVSQIEQKRLRRLSTVHSSVTSKKAETESVEKEQYPENSSNLRIEAKNIGIANAGNSVERSQTK